MHPPLLQPHRGEGEVQSGDSEHRGPALNQTSPLVHPPCDMSPRQLPEGEPVAVELMNDTSQKEGQAGQHAQLFMQDEPVRACGGESDGFAYLDARAHTLLEHCRQLLASSSTPSNEVRGNVLYFVAHLCTLFQLCGVRSMARL